MVSYCSNQYSLKGTCYGSSRYHLDFYWNSSYIFHVPQFLHLQRHFLVISTSCLHIKGMNRARGPWDLHSSSLSFCEFWSHWPVRSFVTPQLGTIPPTCVGDSQSQMCGYVGNVSISNSQCVHRGGLKKYKLWSHTALDVSTGFCTF